MEQDKLEHQMKMHENRELFSDALQALPDPPTRAGWALKVCFWKKTIGFVVPWH